MLGALVLQHSYQSHIGKVRRDIPKRWSPKLQNPWGQKGVGYPK